MAFVEEEPGCYGDRIKGEPKKQNSQLVETSPEENAWYSKH